MAERWREWEPPIRIEAAVLEQAIWLPDGRVLGEPEFTWSEGQIDRFRQGYKCMRCMEPLEVAWPERCPACGYLVRTLQAEFFAQEYGGEIEIKKRNWEQELEGLEERRRKEEEDRGKSKNDQLGR